MKTRWVIASLGVASVVGYFLHDYSQRPTIRFIGHRPHSLEPDLTYKVPAFEIRNETRYPFSIPGETRTFRIFTDSGVRVVKSGMNCTGIHYFTIYPGQTVELLEWGCEAAAGQRFSMGIGFCRGTAAELSGSSSALAPISDWVCMLLPLRYSEPKITWSDIAEYNP